MDIDRPAASARPVANDPKRKCAVSFDDLVDARENHRRNRETQCFGGFEIDGQIEFGPLLYGQLTRFGGLENSIDVNRGAAVQVGIARTIEAGR